MKIFSKIVAIAMIAMQLASCGHTLYDAHIILSPAGATVNPGGTVQYSVSVDNHTYSGPLNYEAGGVPGGNSTYGTITTAGLYTAPPAETSNLVVPIQVNDTITNEKGEVVNVNVSTTVTVLGSGGGNGPVATISVSPQTISSGQSATLSWSCTNSSKAVISPVVGSQSDGTVDLQGSATVSPTETTVYALTCTGNDGTTATGSATLTVNGSSSGIVVAVSPTTVTLTSQQTQEFASTVSNDPSNQGVTWTASDGTPLTVVDAFHADYTPPIVQGNVTVFITATSVADNTKSAMATVTVQPQGGGGGDNCNEDPPPIVNFSEGIINLSPGQTSDVLNLILISGTLPDLSSTFTLNPAVGTINVISPTSVTYTAPSNVTLATTTLTAQNIQCAEIKAFATIQVH